MAQPIQFHGFHIDLATSDDAYLFVDVDGFTVAIKREDEGIVVDIFPLNVADEAIASTYAFHNETATQSQGGDL